MPFVLNAASTVTCTHAAKVSHFPTQTRVLVGGSPVLVQTDSSSIVGCPFTIPTGKPSPCVTLRWTVGATRVFAGGTPVLLQTSVGLGMSPEQAPQGPPIVSAVQPRVQAL
jgi:hypothetical protein